MEFWELDIYRRPLVDQNNQTLWELLVCTSQGEVRLAQLIPAAQVKAGWIEDQLRELIQTSGAAPSRLRVFRAASYNLAAPACHALDIPLERTGRAIAIQRWLLHRERSIYPARPGYCPPSVPLAVQRPVPQPLPDQLLPQRWGFSALPARELELLQELTIPHGEIPLVREQWDDWLWLQTVPGLFLFTHNPAPLIGWLEEKGPVALSFIEAELNAILLETDTQERWVLATFSDPPMQAAGQQFTARQEHLQGLHFLAIQPSEDSEDLAAFWLLQASFT
ncbi:Tab2 family RNA-binding protein [Anthocerotibacter panamensis]|uniref:Tab2 family RNA-binding protein n=1 Tax=Anthocerotibacter panamensis TaxID=2857077 RepID=UPI001C403FF2|nr:Tab2 family RNA-binding protein [Anthocerotibacter panamensis]